MKAKPLPKKRRFSKKKKVIAILSVFIFVLFVVFLTYVHLAMTFRTSDEKTQKLFKEAGVEVTIDYMDTSLTDDDIRIISTGKNTDQTVLFIHGAPGSGDNFYSYMKHLKLLEKARMVSYDRPGYGYSGYGDSMISIEEQTRVLAAIIDNYKLKNVIVVGHSYGGPIAAYAPLLSDEVSAVIMLAPAMDPEHEKYFLLGKLAWWKLTRWLVPGSWSVSADEKYAHAAELEKLISEWEAVKVPVVCLQGDKDRLVPYENLAFCEKYFDPDHFRGMTLKDEDHFIPWTREPLVMEELMKLLE